MNTEEQDRIAARLEEFANILPNPFYWLGLDQQYLVVNLSTIEVTGTASFEENFLGKTPLDLYPRQMAEEIIAHHKEVIQTGNVMCTEESIEDLATKETKFFTATIAPFYDDRKNIIGTCGISIDITQEKKLTKQLKIANAAKSTFIANMSHDIRTPITGMLGMAQDMLNTANQAESDLNEQQPQKNNADILKNIIKIVTRDSQLLMGATDELLQLCNEILEVVCLESGNLSDDAESFSLRDLIDHNIELLLPVAHHKKLHLSYEIGQSIPRYLNGFHIYLDRVLLNLISNALKFTEKGRVKVSVSLLHGDNADASIGEEISLQILVEDTGVGIPKDKFDTIFGHFSRLTPAYEGLYKGAGLGLYTVNQYIQAMNGSICVDSELGKGTCFTVTLPFTVSNHADHIQQPVRLPKKVTSAAHKKNLEKPKIVSIKEASFSILIVEDNEMAAIALQRTLDPFNCHIDIAENGAKAVAMAQEGQYDLILMDIGLPDFTGIEATKKIRSLGDAEKSHVPIVALTGHANNPETRQEAIDAGMQEVLSKPAKPLALESVLQRNVFKVEAKSEDAASKSLVVIDWDASVHMCNSNPKDAHMLLSVLADDLENMKSTLSKAYVNHDTKALRDELHRIRGGVCYLKLPQLDKALEIFHEVVKDVPQDPDRLEKTYAELQQAIDNFETAWVKEFK